MSFVNKQLLAFQRCKDVHLQPRRSEGRMKTYVSSLDARAWSDTVEQRRQHILELMIRSRSYCLGKYIPLEILIEQLLRNQNGEIQRLYCTLYKLFNILDKANLTRCERRAVDRLKNRLKKQLSPCGDAPIDCKGLASRQEPTESVCILEKMNQPEECLAQNEAESNGSSKNEAECTGSMNEAECTGSSMNEAECTGSSKNEAEYTGSSLNEAECTGSSLNEAECTGSSMNEPEGTGSSLIDAECDFSSIGERFMHPCRDEVLSLEKEIEKMRHGQLTPEQEAAVIKREVKVLKRYCCKLSFIEEENQKLKKERDNLLSRIETGSQFDEIERLRKELADLLEERNELILKLKEFEKLEEELEEMRAKLCGIGGIEREMQDLKCRNRNASQEYKRVKSRCSDLEMEVSSLRCQIDSFQSQLRCQNQEMESLRSKAKDLEIIRLDRDRLQIKLNEMSQVQIENESMLMKVRQFEAMKCERDVYKSKYEELVCLESKYEMLKAQLDSTKNLSKEKELLQSQVTQLEACVCSQETEIRRLSKEIESYAQLNDMNQARVKEAIESMKQEVLLKDQLLAASEEKILAMQDNLRCSIKSQSSESNCLQKHVMDLEAELRRCKCTLNERQNLICQLQQQLREKDKCLQNIDKRNRHMSKAECNAISVMKKELEVARDENKKLQCIAEKMVSITGDEYVQEVIKQSECAIKKVVEEIGRQYQEWEQIKSKIAGDCEGIESAGCKCKEHSESTISEEIIHELEKSNDRISQLECENALLKRKLKCDDKCRTMCNEMNENSEKLRRELEEVTKEKMKLQKLVQDMCGANTSECTYLKSLKERKAGACK